MREKRVLQTMKFMAWERAKGELKSILHTFYPEYTSNNEEIESGYDALNKLIYEFIEEFESNHM